MNTQSAGAKRQLAGFIRKFSPTHQQLIRSVRAALRETFPTAHELVYDNYNFLAIGYCSTHRPSDCVFSIAAAANGVALCFTHGAKLPDATKILAGSGKQTRFLRLPSAVVLQRPDVARLLRLANGRADTPFADSGTGELIIRSVAAKQRPRRKPSRRRP